jgi:hypothetical protein
LAKNTRFGKVAAVTAAEAWCALLHFLQRRVREARAMFERLLADSCMGTIELPRDAFEQAAAKKLPAGDQGEYAL